MKRRYVSLPLAVALMLLALPVVAAPDAGFAAPGSGVIANVLDVVAGFWGIVAPGITDSTTSSAETKDGDDRDDTLPLDKASASILPNG